MQVVQATFGVFHHFDLARELEARGYLKRIYSTFPWQRLKREGVSRELIRRFPWIHTPQLLAGRMVNLSPGLNQSLAYINAIAFDRWVSNRLPECDAFVALSGSAVRSGRKAQQQGARYVCDRGSSHIRYQQTILNEEYARWGVNAAKVDPRIVAREEAEYAQADAISIPSQFAWRTFVEMGIDAKKLRKIPYGVRLDRFYQSDQPSSGSFDVLFAGAVSIRKGIPYLLEAFANFNHPSKILRLAGAIEPEMRSLLSRFDLTGVELLGPLPQPELVQWMSRSHVLVLPSIEDGFGLVMAQAMAYGTPVIASEHTGGADLFTNGVEGFIVPIRSPDAIRERLLWLADAPEVRQRMSEAALARVRSLGGWHDYGEQYSDFLKDLTGRA
jgi:glycosyltransferase involved in cell wall biosynthesis